MNRPRNLAVAIVFASLGMAAAAANAAATPSSISSPTSQPAAKTLIVTSR